MHQLPDPHGLGFSQVGTLIEQPYEDDWGQQLFERWSGLIDVSNTADTDEPEFTNK